jgi:hypothetical protein
MSSWYRDQSGGGLVTSGARLRYTGSMTRRFLGILPVAVLVMCVGVGCGKGKDKNKGDKGSGGEASSSDLMTRCEELGKACGDSDKHIEKIVAECKEAAKEQVASGCTEKAVAAYDCFQKQLCGKADKVWALGDLGVLSQRHGVCAAERDASAACVGGK